METHVISARGKEVIIGDNQPTVLIGEKINPFGKGPIKDALISGDMGPIREEAEKQVEAGADILIISVAAFGIDETHILPAAAKAVMEAVDVPLCLESRNPVALENTLQLGCGRPIISSITGEDAHLEHLLPLVKKYNTAFVALASDSSGVPSTALRRGEIIAGILERSREMGIDPVDIIADCVAEIERGKQRCRPYYPGNDGDGKTSMGTQPCFRGKQCLFRFTEQNSDQRSLSLSCRLPGAYLGHREREAHETLYYGRRSSHGSRQQGETIYDLLQKTAEGECLRIV
ncbi:MAG: Pterin binding enzyme [Deltaproteobacteria bacterium]|nr:Pterin binding enzyme [Deltaproteobacteria bacterium]